MTATATRPTVIVTGGNSGIGLECARSLARAGRHVVIASRNREASEAALRLVAADGSPGPVEAMDLDLSEPASIREFAAAIAARDLAVDALVCNAGLQFFRGPVRSREGWELTFAVNHLGHFRLVHLLLARLLRQEAPRIVVVSSGVHDPRRPTGMPKARIGDMDVLARTGCATMDRYNGGLAYVNSKLCNLWFAYELARRLDAAGLSHPGRPVAVNAFDPGLVPGSGLARDYHPALRAVWDRALPALAFLLTAYVPGISTAEKSGGELARLVVDPRLGVHGARYYPSHTRWLETPSSPDSYDAGRAKELWEFSARIAGLAPGESPLLG